MYVVQMLVFAACLVFHGANADSAPGLEVQANFPYVVLVVDQNLQTRYASLVLSKKFVLTHVFFQPSVALSSVAIYLGEPTAVLPVNPIRIYNNGNLAVLKFCSKGNPVNQFYDLTPSAFYDFSSAANAPAKHIFYDINKDFYFVNTTVLTDNNCPADRTLYGDFGSYNSTSVGCTKGDPTATCGWHKPSSEPKSYSLLMVQSQAVGILIDGSCPSTLLWQSTVLYTKILPHRSYIVQTIA